MKKMKYLIIISLLLSLSGCNFLDREPYSDIAERFFYENEDEVNTGVVGCYNQLQGVMRYEWSVTELRSDNTRAYGVNSTATPSVELVNSDQNAFMTSNNNVNGYWEACYTGLFRVNSVLKYLHVVPDVTNRNRVEGEMKFLRAHFYFNLVRLWGPVFLMSEPITAGAARYKQRSSVDEVYAFIIEDLKRVVDGNLLPTRDAQAAKDKGHVVAEAAKVLLAKVYMTRYKVADQEYKAANDLLKEVIVSCGNPQSATDLVSYSDIFDINKEMNKEIIFTVRYKAGNLGLGSPFANFFAPNLSGSNVVKGDGSSWNYVTSNLIAAFNEEPADVRKNLSLAESYLNTTTGKEVTEIDNPGAARYIKKYISPGMITKGDGESDWPVIRMGDVLLLYAETQNELGGSEALQYLNMIRVRAGLTEIIAGGNTFDIRQTIRAERRKELAFENHRFFDILRYGNAAAHINNFVHSEGFYEDAKAYPYTDIKDWNLLLPIPQKVMNINPDLAQNVGY